METTEYFLNPGELIFSKKPIVIKTVLGSCVAVCLHDKANKFGGMCHYLLPEANGNEVSTKYGNIAIQTLINKFLNAGSDPKNMEAFIIGGAFIIFSEREIFFIGDRNADIAAQILKKHQIAIRSVNTGGEHGKKVVLNSYTNQCVVQSLEHIEIEDLYNTTI
jgi:chemotaxis protein CheD